MNHGNELTNAYEQKMIPGQRRENANNNHKSRHGKSIKTMEVVIVVVVVEGHMTVCENNV